MRIAESKISNGSVRKARRDSGCRWAGIRTVGNAPISPGGFRGGFPCRSTACERNSGNAVEGQRKCSEAGNLSIVEPSGTAKGGSPGQCPRTPGTSPNRPVGMSKPGLGVSGAVAKAVRARACRRGVDRQVGGGRWELRVLGPLEVRFAGRPVPVGGARQRAVLAALLLCRGRMVPTSSLVDRVWEGREPASAVNTLQSYVSRLRALFSSPVEGRADAPVIRGESGGYLLDVPDEQVDSARFERLLTAGRAELAAGDASTSHALFSAALDLWRGPMLGDLNGAVGFRAETARMEDLRISAVELMADSEIALGRPDQAIARLREVSAAHPLREGPVARLMRAMYHSGRPADALALYGDIRQRFVDELGIEPGAELGALQQAILRRERIPGFEDAVTSADRRGPTRDRRHAPTATAAGGTVTSAVVHVVDAVRVSEGAPRPHQPLPATARRKPAGVPPKGLPRIGADGPSNPVRDTGRGPENRERLRERFGEPWGRPSPDLALKPYGSRRLGCGCLDPSADGRDDGDVVFRPHRLP
ncbi:BTAD domain-containing putative transcriptional regulator [Streptomyces sp. NPDC002888]|uniref:AfsR/SARP family transcriptional regulator n=1 Tax=Streptomyces sp. NPDC002888 TaxID=3364668 RepID=UPI0036AF11BD